MEVDVKHLPPLFFILTYKVWPDAYSLEDQGYLETTGRYNNYGATPSIGTYSDTGYPSNTDRQSAGATQVSASASANHWFTLTKPIDLSKWNYLCYGYYVGLSGVPTEAIYVSGMVGLVPEQNLDCLWNSSHEHDGAYEEFRSPTLAYGKYRYYIRSSASSLLSNYTEGYLFVKCDISACEQTDCYLGCGAMFGGGTGTYRYLKLLDGYGPFLYENASDCTLTAPSGNTMSFTMTMTDESNKYILSTS